MAYCVHQCNACPFIIGAVFRRSSSLVQTVSANGVGSLQFSFQGYEVITGRISSPNLGA